MKTGNEVKWESQSGGSWKEKKGKIIREIPAFESAMKHVPETAKKSHIKFKDVSEMDRVLVAVLAGKGGQITHYYCPNKTTLIMQGNEP